MSGEARNLVLLEKVEDVIIVHFGEPRLTDMDVIDEVGSQLYRLVDEAGYKRILLNFAEVEHMSSTMLAKLMGLHKRAEGIGGRLVLCCISPSLIDVFKITKLNQILKIYNDEERAIHALVD